MTGSIRRRGRTRTPPVFQRCVHSSILSPARRENSRSLCCPELLQLNIVNMAWLTAVLVAACLLGGGQAIIAGGDQATVAGGGQATVSGGGQQRRQEEAETPKSDGRAASKEDEYQQSNSHSYPVYHHAEHGYGGEEYAGHPLGGAHVVGYEGGGGGLYPGAHGGGALYAGAHGGGAPYPGAQGGGGLYPGAHGGGGLYPGAHGGHGVGVSGYAGLEVGVPRQHYVHHYYGGGEDHKTVALKGLLVPLAGVALLGAAAALVSNPVLLQLGVLSGRRRRRDAQSSPAARRELALLETFMAQVPREQAERQEKQLLANYLECGSAANSSASSLHCVERLACELYHPLSQASQLDRHVMAIVAGQILSNEYVPPAVKKRVEKAARTGSLSRDCSVFPCSELGK